MKSQSEILAIISDATSFTRDHDGSGVVDTYTVVGTNNSHITVSSNELSLLDHRLPYVLAQLHKRMTGRIALTTKLPKKLPIQADWVRATLDFWRGDALSMIDGITPIFVASVSKISRLEHSNKKGLLCEVKAFSTDHMRAEINGVIETIEYVPYTYPVEIIVPYAWFDKNYPQWEIRLALLESLGMSDEAFAKAILTKPQNLESASLDGVNLE